MALITTISYKIAFAITSFERATLKRFHDEATCNEYMDFTHYNFLITGPEFGKEWRNGKDIEYHKVETKCHLCSYRPDRNYAGIGSLYLLHNGISDETIVKWSGTGKNRTWKEVPNTETRMILLCPNHVGSHFKWDDGVKIIKPQIQQLQLF